MGLIATAASVRSGAYERTLHRLDETIHVVSRACPLLVPLVENGRYQPGDAVIETVAREYLEPLRQEGLDVLILGCTHYPLLTDIIREIMGPEVSLVNAGAESVHTLHDALARRQLLAPEGTGQALLCTSDRPEGFGASFVGDQVFKSVDNSFSAIPGGCLHPQAVAPGFQMYTCWMIRHLDGDPWLQTTRNEDERYLWLHDAQE